jgi:hypothetical protein
MPAGLIVTFKATGEGTVLCERKTQDGEERPPITYALGRAPAPWMLTDEQRDDFRRAYFEEFDDDPWPELTGAES